MHYVLLGLRLEGETLEAFIDLMARKRYVVRRLSLAGAAGCSMGGQPTPCARRGGGDGGRAVQGLSVGLLRKRTRSQTASPPPSA